MAAISILIPSASAAETLAPSQWPTEVALGSAPNAIRFGGNDRNATSAAIALALRGAGQFPFDSPDRTSAGVATLADATGWWGAATCPASVIVVAGDRPADALAAAALSDPTNHSNEPRLARSAAVDPAFDPIGELDRVDTDAAPIIVTASRRSGALGLAGPARAALSDLRAGGCTAAREAIIVGGSAAVPTEVEQELLDLGYEEVFRVAGFDRFDTAAAIAMALGTEPAPQGATCADRNSDDGSSAMAFYGNAIIEFRPTSSTCEVHGRTVVLADGEVGADAVAAGWWTSYWQVPLLLVDADGSLPDPTRAALERMDIDTIVVLGGTSRIPEAIAQEAGRLATASVGRFAGVDRYETSAVMASRLGGWYPTGDPDDFVGDRACFAASAGGAGASPDALAAGPFCGRLAVIGATQRTPIRTFEPIADATRTPSPPEPPHHAVPMLLVPTGATAPTASVSALLGDAFAPAGGWCQGDAPVGCRMPGFAFAFGGSAAVPDALLGRLSSLVAGGASSAEGVEPLVAEPFRTGLDLAPVFVGEIPQDASRACFERGGVVGARWLAVYLDRELRSFSHAADLMRQRAYEATGSLPLCVDVGSTVSPTIVAVSGAGKRSGLRHLSDADRWTTMSDSMRHGGPLASDGEPGTSGAASGETTWTFREAPSGPLEVRRGEDDEFLVQEASAVIRLTRGRRHRFVAHLRLEGEADELVGEATGEAVLVGGRWELAGRFRTPSANGGFRGTIQTNDTEMNSDDLLTWRVDAIRT